MMRSISVLLILLSHVPAAHSADTIANLAVPAGYQRIQYPPGSFSHYLQHLPLKSDQTIYQYNGKKVWGVLYNVLAVVDRPLLFKSDLEQCADFCMRFWADYHHSRGRLDDLFLYDYNGNKRYLRGSGKSYQSFLKWHMAYANSHSIKKGAEKITDHRLNPGDMFVQNQHGGIGHVSLIVDAAVNAKGRRIYRIGFGFMPAQEFHIETAQDLFGIDGWFTQEGYTHYLTTFPFGRYGPPVLRRFKQEHPLAEQR